MENFTPEQLLIEKNKLHELKIELDLKNQQMWTMSETVYKEKKKIEEQLNEMLSQKLLLEKQKSDNEETVKQLWEQSTAIHNEKQRIEKLKAEVESRHQEMVDSVQYAKLIQLAILPSEEIVKKSLPESFIFFKPKNIVSGDFYWVHELQDNKVLFAAVDCTGHGVPGAFMSILAYNLLEQTITASANFKPSEILSELSNAIIKSLKQTTDINSVKDGMDLALCLIDFKNLKLQFSGAHNPLYIVRNNAVIEFKADSKSIGFSYSNNNLFTNTEIDLIKGDCIYVFSDGFVDQKGGLNKTKFFYNPFRQLLISLHDKSMNDQKQILEDVFTKWKGNNSQIDDVLVLGVKV